MKRRKHLGIHTFPMLLTFFFSYSCKAQNDTFRLSQSSSLHNSDTVALTFDEVALDPGEAFIRLVMTGFKNENGLSRIKGKDLKILRQSFGFDYYVTSDEHRVFVKDEGDFSAHIGSTIYCVVTSEQRMGENISILFLKRIVKI